MNTTNTTPITENTGFCVICKTGNYEHDTAWTGDEIYPTREAAVAHIEDAAHTMVHGCDMYDLDGLCAFEIEDLEAECRAQFKIVRPAASVLIKGASMHAISLPCESVEEGRRIAEDFGTTADEAEVYDGNGDILARHRRNCEDDGGWYEAEC